MVDDSSFMELYLEVSSKYAQILWNLHRLYSYAAACSHDWPTIVFAWIEVLSVLSFFLIAPIFIAAKFFYT